MKQSGFTLVEVLLILIGLGLFTGVGLYGYSLIKDKDQVASSDSTVKTSTQSPAAEKVDNKQYLEIKEAGVKVELTSSLQDTYYAVQENGISLSSHKLDGVAGFEGCTLKTEYGGMAALESSKITDYDSVMLKPTSKSTVGDTYYWLTPVHQAPCFNPDTVSDDDEHLKIVDRFKVDITKQNDKITAL